MSNLVEEMDELSDSGIIYLIMILSGFGSKFMHTADIMLVGYLMKRLIFKSGYLTYFERNLLLKLLNRLYRKNKGALDADI